MLAAVMVAHALSFIGQQSLATESLEGRVVARDAIVACGGHEDGKCHESFILKLSTPLHGNSHCILVVAFPAGHERLRDRDVDGKAFVGVAIREAECDRRISYLSRAWACGSGRCKLVHDWQKLGTRASQADEGAQLECYKLDGELFASES